VDVRPGHLGLTGRPDRPDDVAFGDRGALLDRGGAEVHERDREAARRLDRHDEPAPRDAAGERDDSTGGRAHRAAGSTADVDPAVLARGVRVAAERELAEHRAVGRPSPRASCGRDEQRG
jgi:hypothetical protein